MGEQPAAPSDAFHSSPAALQHDEQQAPLDLLILAAAKQGRKVRGDLHQQHKLLAGLSHLHLDAKQLAHLDSSSLKQCPKLQVRDGVW